MQAREERLTTRGARPAWAEIDLAALESNLAFARRLAGRREVIAVVKADAYGHGAIDVSRRLAASGCRRLAVVTVAEAMELREAGIELPLLVLGGVHDVWEATLAAEQRLTPVLHDRRAIALLREVAASGPALPVQIEVDTGMHRMGVPPETAAPLMAEVAAEPCLRLEGVYTHLACADDPSPEASLEQLARFRGVLAEARERGIDPGLVHADNSAALLTGKTIDDALPEAAAVRPGLMLYGARGASHLDPGRQLQPVMSVRARVVALREVAAGAAVGYGASHRPLERTRIATLPIGYADGVSRALGNRGVVWLAGARRPIVGRVSMDYITVDVGDARVEVGDVATFFGAAAPFETAAPFGAAESDPIAGAGVTVDEVARAAETLAYELLVRVGNRVPRRLVGLE